MDLLFAFILGLGAAAGAVLLPGMLNMSVVKTCMRCSRREAIIFAAGIVTIFAVQAGIAIIGTEFLRSNLTVLQWLKYAAVPIFAGLSASFFYKGYRKHHADEYEDEEEPTTNPRGHYFGGLSLAVLNTLAIPYFFVLTGYLLNQGWLANTVPTRIIFLLSAALGAFGIFSGYAMLAPWIKRNVGMLARYLNFFVGGLLGTLALVQTFRLLTT